MNKYERAIRYTRGAPTRSYDTHTQALAASRKAYRPIRYALTAPDPRYPKATEFKVYPSGRFLWAVDQESPLQCG